MAYTKQTWQCGDVVTAEKLNHIEEGIEECCGGGGAEDFIVTITVNPATVDKTYAEIASALENGDRVVGVENYDTTKYYYYLSMWSETVIALTASYVSESGNTIAMRTLYIYADGTTTTQWGRNLPN